MRHILVIGGIIIGILLAIMWSIGLLTCWLFPGDRIYSYRALFSLGTLIIALILFSVSFSFAIHKQLLQGAAFVLVMLTSIFFIVMAVFST